MANGVERRSDSLGSSVIGVVILRNRDGSYFDVKDVIYGCVFVGEHAGPGRDVCDYR